ncbi:MAG: hypothetical protein MZU97_10570 [Bacillus subtilis]|nr:hypothetical protein [Bacillus subtilis]
MVKIGTRWYLIASIYSRTVHGVGGFSYWKGDENTTITEVDWKSKPEQSLDGEDLCAGQLVQVGDPLVPVRMDSLECPVEPMGRSVDLGAGSISIEERGSRGVRLDPHLSDLINRGTILDLRDITPTTIYGSATHENGVTAVKGGSEARYGFDAYGETRLPDTYGRIIVDYVLDLSDANSRAGLLLKNTDSAVRHFVYVDRAASMLVIYSRTPKATMSALRRKSSLKIGAISKSRSSWMGRLSMCSSTIGILSSAASRRPGSTNSKTSR